MSDRYVVRYAYVTPAPSGPFRGKVVMDTKPAKGDSIYGPFGAARVTSVTLVKRAV